MEPTLVNIKYTTPYSRPVVTERHEHLIASPHDWPWLPTRRGGPTIRHPLCADCGLVKAVGSDRPLKDGGIQNLVAALSDLFSATGRKVSEAQRRLIRQQLAELDADDAFAYTREAQIALFVDIYSRYTGVPPEVVLSHMEQVHA